MTTLSQVGKDIKKGMKFKDEKNNVTDYWEVSGELTMSGQFSWTIDVVRYCTDGTYISDYWNDWEVSGSNYYFTLVDPESWGYGQQELKIEEPKRCWHSEKKKILLFASAYWYCPECKSDLGNCTEEEYQKCVKENI